MVDTLRHFGMSFSNDRSIFYFFQREDIEEKFPPTIEPHNEKSPRYWDEESTAQIVSYFTKADPQAVLEYLNSFVTY